MPSDQGPGEGGILDLHPGLKLFNLTWHMASHSSCRPDSAASWRLC